MLVDIILNMQALVQVVFGTFDCMEVKVFRNELRAISGFDFFQWERARHKLSFKNTLTDSVKDTSQEKQIVSQGPWCDI